MLMRRARSAGPPHFLSHEGREMSVSNQISHREAFRKQQAAGQVQSVGGKRHGLGKNKPRPQPRPKQRQAQRPNVIPGGQTLAEMLGIELSPAEKAKAAAATAPAPLEPLTPPPTANVPETAAPETQVDPLLGEGELPPVAEVKQADDPEPPRPMVQPWSAPSGPVVPEAEDADEEEDGRRPLI